jgi:tetratricopeptide (TPR) repeat protein
MPTIKKRGNAAKKREPEQEIRTLAHNASEFMAAHRKNFIIVVAAVAAVLILAAGYRIMQSMQEQKATPLVASAYGYYSPSQGTTGADFVKALELFRSIRKQYPSTRSGAIAQYYIGNCLANLGRNDEALTEYQTFVSKYAGDKFLLGLVYERMGHVYNELGKQADAIKSFEQSENLIGPGISTLELARLYEAAGNASAAQQKYKTISDKLAGTAWAMEATGKVQKISPMQLPVPPSGGK